VLSLASKNKTIHKYLNSDVVITFTFQGSNSLNQIGS